MQATLLGLATAMILALVAALVGPHFVDWTQYRARFESEATRVAGMPVRIAGAIDARILPTPTLTLGRVEFGNATQPQAKVRELYLELALGSLMRGEWRASEIRVVGPEVSLGVAANGRFEWPTARMGFDPDQLQIEKAAIEDGRIALRDGGSGTDTVLEGFWFKGDLRSLIGPVKGEGGFIAAGERYGYRLAASRAAEDGIKVKLALDPSDHPLAIEVDGSLRLDESSPRFEGALTLARPVAVAGASGRGTVAVPWRATAKVKVAPTHALFEQFEYQYGPEARAIRLAGTAELRFGKSPRFESVLSARQVDLDRALALPEASGRLPLAALKAFIEPFAASYRPPFPVRLGIGVDAVTLAAGTLQNLRGDIRLDGDGWDIEQLEFRAPGFAQVRLSGRLASGAQGISFKGPAQVESSDPRALLAWLEGRDALQRQAGVLRAGGELTIGTQAFAVERLKFEFDRKTIEGRFAYAGADGARPPRLDAELKAGDLDIDGVLAFGRAALEGTALERPREVSLSVDIGRASLAGIDVKGVSGTFKLDPEGLTFDRVRIADLADAAFSLNGRMEGALDAPRGTVTFDVDARGLDGTVAVLANYLPQAADPLRHIAGKIVPLKARATLGIEPVSSTDPRGASKIKFALDGTAGALRLKIGTEASGDVGALRLPEFRLDAQVAATDGAALVTLLGLDRAVTVDKRAGTLTVALRSAAGSDARVDARLNAGGLAASANGTARIFHADGLAAALDLTLQAADAGPLRRGTVQPAILLPVAMRAKLNASANELALENMTGAVGGSPVRGSLKIGLGTPRRIDGRVEADAIDVPALLAVAAGMPRTAPRADAQSWAGDPFGASVLADLVGRVEFSATRATFAPALTGRQVKGVVRLGSGEVSLDGLEGTLAGGRASGQLTLRRSADGLGLRARIALAGADAAALLPGEGKPPVSGRFGLTAEIEGNGLSPASLTGSLSGNGMIVLEDAQFSGLDPRAFNAAVRAVDQGHAIEARKIHDIVGTVLDGGPLPVPRLDAALTVNAGQVRISPTTVYGQGADLLLAGGADLADGSLDARLTLTGPIIAEGSNSIRPEILVALRGPVAAPRRTIDVAALSGWLMLRSVERQSKRLDAMEAERISAERREAERRDAEARAVTSTAPAALPAPVIMDETAAPTINTPPARPSRPRPTAVPARTPEQAPVLPPPLNIGPAPGVSKSGRAPNPPGGAAANPQQTPPPPPRSALETLFGLQR